MYLLLYAEIDIFGIIILYLFLRNQLRSGSYSLDDQIFNGILIVAMVEQLMDAGQWLLDGANFPGVYVLQMLCYTLGYAVAPAITCLWAMYCDLRVNSDERGLKRRAPLYAIPMVLNTALLIANLFTPLVFRIDVAHVYHRGSFFLVYMILMYMYGVVSLLLVIRKALNTTSSLERTEFRYMALFIIPPLIGGALQWMYYGLSLIWVCAVISISLVYINVLNRQISTDPLTGLNNRRKLNRYLDLKIHSAEADQAMFLMMLDADGFKSINDIFGHSVGDRALVAIAEILKTLCQNRDCFLARLGGDEFVVLGRERDSTNPEALAQQLEDRVTEYNATTAEPFRLSLSVGWTRFTSQQANTADMLLSIADRNMYRVKAAKRPDMARNTHLSNLS